MKYLLGKSLLLATLSSVGLTISFASSHAQAQFGPSCPVKYTFFQKADGGGKSRSACSGSNISNLKDVCFKYNSLQRCVSTWNDSISSITGGTFTLYSDTNFQGGCITVRASGKIVNLGNFGFDDVASSLKSGGDKRCKVVN